ncbi:MAG: 6-phosphofructokinase [Clostridia bacterium]|nr:6-phosphofructokinase [Clostridia bacterium]
MENKEKRILRGNAVVGQSGGPTAAINATLAGVIRGVIHARTAAPDCGIVRLFGMRNGVDGLLRDDIIDLDALFDPAFGGTPADLDTLALTPSSGLGSCRKKLPAPGSADEEAVMGSLLSILRAHDVRYFFYIGGNDSMDTVAKLSAYADKQGYEMRVMGVPKTIDNDLMGTDHTPGFGSAAKYIAVTTQEILRDTAVYTVPAVTIIEIMGRDAGWLTASSALGRLVTGFEPDLVYLPERPFIFDEFYEDVAAALKKHPNVVVAVSEGLQCPDGSYVGEGTQSGSVDVFGHKYLAGTGKALELAVKAKFGCKVRSVELNLPQRCAAHIVSAQDIEESLAVGEAAVDAALCGVSRAMMGFARTGDEPYAYGIGAQNIADIANRTRCVPDEFINARGNQVTDACVKYLLPLIRGEMYPEYENGLPKHYIFK